MHDKKAKLQIIVLAGSSFLGGSSTHLSTDQRISEARHLHVHQAQGLKSQACNQSSPFVRPRTLLFG
jgi:hypothetical protein